MTTPFSDRPVRRNTTIKKDRPWGIIGISVGLLLFFVAVLFYATVNTGKSGPASKEVLATPDIKGVSPATKDLSRKHTAKPEDNVKYASYPPLGGEHNPVWQVCDSYTAPVRTERALHSMEHGAVWISYRSGLDEKGIEELQSYARPGQFVLVAPALEEQSDPVILTAWGVQLKVSDASDKRVKQFVDTYENGPQTPEPGATCAEPGLTDTVPVR